MAKRLDQITEHQPMEAQDGLRTADVGVGQLKVGERVNAVCTVVDIARALGVTVARVHQLRKQGHLERFLLDSLGDGKARYSGEKLQRWIDGERQDAVLRSASRHYFGSARKRVI